MECLGQVRRSRPSGMIKVTEAKNRVCVSCLFVACRHLKGSLVFNFSLKWQCSFCCACSKCFVYIAWTVVLALDHYIFVHSTVLMVFVTPDTTKCISHTSYTHSMQFTCFDRFRYFYFRHCPKHTNSSLPAMKVHRKIVVCDEIFQKHTLDANGLL